MLKERLGQWICNFMDLWFSNSCKNGVCFLLFFNSKNFYLFLLFPVGFQHQIMTLFLGNTSFLRHYGDGIQRALATSSVSYGEGADLPLGP